MAKYFRRRNTKNGDKSVIYCIILGLIGLDQLTKFLTVQTFDLHTGMTILNDIISLFYIQNTGAAWGILAGNMTMFYIITVLVLGGMFYWYHFVNKRQLHWAEKLSYMLIVSGALGNFIDRLRLGYVVDMIKFEFIDFPIFNVADIYLTIGVILMMFYSLFLEKEVKNGQSNI